MVVFMIMMFITLVLFTDYINPNLLTRKTKDPYIFNESELPLLDHEFNKSSEIEFIFPWWFFYKN